MRKYLLLLTLVIVCRSYGQRAPIRYIPIDSISSIPSGLNVKLDFKGVINYTGRVPTYYPWLKSAKPTGTGWTGDTVCLTINKQQIEFVEKKGIGVDYYMFRAERLVSTTYKKNRNLVIHSSVIKEINNDSVLVRLSIGLYKTSGKKVSSREDDLWVRLNDLEGVLINELDLEESEWNSE